MGEDESLLQFSLLLTQYLRHKKGLFIENIVQYAFDTATAALN